MNIQDIANKINSAGGRLYLVGGALRDEIMGKEKHDEDYCVTGLSSEEFMALFPVAHIRGKSFEVYDIENKEFALARTEIKSGLGHKEFEVTTSKDITIQEDLKRRDITVNSIAKDVLTKELIDPFNGVEDIKNKTIRATSKAFIEDPLRVYRVARFATQLKFTVDKNTLKLMNSLKKELYTLSKERVFLEFKKALEQEKPSIFFEVLRNADVLDIHFKEIYNLIGALQPIKYHPEGDAYNHTMIVLDEICKNTKDLKIRFAGLVHDLGKGITPKQEYPYHYGHDIKGANVVKQFGKNLKIPKAWVKCGVISATEHMRGGIFFKMKPTKQVQFLERVGKSDLGLDGLQLVVNADKGSREEIDNFANLGKEMFKKINGEYILKEYRKLDGLEIKQKLYEERIKYIKSQKNT